MDRKEIGINSAYNNNVGRYFIQPESYDKKHSDMYFNGKKVSGVETTHSESSGYLINDIPEKPINEYAISTSQTDAMSSNLRTDKTDRQYQLTDAQINKKVKRMIKYCEDDNTVVIYFTGTQKSALLVWDSVKAKPVYTTLNSDGIIVDTATNLNELRKDILECSDSGCKIKRVRIKGLNTKAIFNKMKAGSQSYFDEQKNNSAQYVADLLKASSAYEQINTNIGDLKSIDTYKLAKKIKRSINKNSKEENIRIANPTEDLHSERVCNKSIEAHRAMSSDLMNEESIYIAENPLFSSDDGILYQPSKAELISQVLYAYDEQTLRRTKKAKVIAKNSSDHAVVIQTEGQESLSIAFPPGVKERVGKNGEQILLVHRDGRYMHLESEEVVKGFGKKYYVIIDGKLNIGKPGEVGVIYGDEAIFIPENHSETLVRINNNYVRVSINGEILVKENIKDDEFEDYKLEKRDDRESEFNNTSRYAERGRALNASYEILGEATSPEKAREALTMLFESDCGQELFIKNDIQVDKDGVLAFLRSYREAVELESKETRPINISHQKKRNEKKRERLLAIDEIGSFLKELDPSDPEYEDKCRLSLQMLGRVRERSLVSQKGRDGWCGGFSAIQIGWGEKPLNMVRVCIGLSKSMDRSVTVPISALHGESTMGAKFKIDRDFNIKNCSSPYADILLIASMFDTNVISTHSDEEAMIMSYLGLDPLPYKISFFNNIYDNVLEDLCLATKKGGKFSATINPGYLSHFLGYMGHNTKPARKYPNAKNIEAEFSKANDLGHYYHSVIIDDVRTFTRNDTDYVALKLHTWGKRFHLILKEETFDENFDRKNIILINEGDETDYLSFKPLQDEVVFTRGDDEITMNRNGLKRIESGGWF